MKGGLGKYLVGITLIAIAALLAVELLTAQGSVQPTIRMSAMAPSCSESAAVFVELADDQPIADAPVDVLINNQYVDRLQTDGNGRFFTVLSEKWCEGDYVITARFNGDRSHAATAAELAIHPPMGLTGGAAPVVAQGSQRLSTLIAELQQSMVKVEMTGSRGSGVILAQENGETVILTNKHVIEPAKSVSDINVIMADHSSVHPSMIYIAPDKMDLVVIVLKGTYGKPAQIAEEGYMLGDDVIALGSPKGIQGSVSKGIISNFGEDTTDAGYKHQIIQTDTAINHGNSGGGLFLADSGKLVGINTFQMKESQGLNFAIDIHEFAKLPDYKTWDQME